MTRLRRGIRALALLAVLGALATARQASAGACCDGLGGCSDVTQAECDAAGGSYQGDGTMCGFGGCGACCDPVGGCTDTVFPTCAESFVPATFCAAAPDPCSLGACCDGVGGCVETDQADCAASGGSYQGDATSCGFQGCGACCDSAGDCTDTVPFTCADSFIAGTFCANTPDPCSLGACCDGAGGCTDTDQADCDASGGSYQGDGTTCGFQGCGACCGASCTDTVMATCADAFVPGTFCAAAPSPCTIGACCGRSGGCSDVDQTECDAVGGSYQGDGTTCGFQGCGACCGASCSDTLPFLCADTFVLGAFCLDTPDPCAANGACCDGAGGCADVDEASCMATGGLYQGDGTACGMAGCGACCGAACTDTVPSTCADTFVPGAFCAASPDPCLPTGACCDGAGGCSEVDESTCTASGGLFQGLGTGCGFAGCGACCGAGCVDAIPPNCADTFVPFTFCANSPEPCSAGACCDGAGGCSELSEADCLAAAGLYQGDATACGFNGCGACCDDLGGCTDSIAPTCADSFVAGTFCAETPDPCTRGACCDGAGGCTDGVDEAGCSASGGVYQGDATSCGVGGCGACCDGGDCTDAVPAACAAPFVFGTFCAETPPPCTVGACCDGVGGCTDGLDAAGCSATGGIYQGDGSACGFGGCGACCGVGGCTDTTGPACTDTFLPGTGCAATPPPCPPAGTGACCDGVGGCSEVDAAACASIGGAYQGAGTTCGSDGCGACCDTAGGCTDTLATTCADTFVLAASCSESPSPCGACLVSALSAPRRLKGVENASSGATFSWQPDAAALEYHLNSVPDKRDLVLPSPHLPDVGIATGECVAAAPATSCDDADALSGGDRYYQVFSACGATGRDEGP